MFEHGESITFRFKRNRWTVRFSDDPRDLDGKPVDGLILPGRREIDIRANLTPHRTVEAVVHEILHLCLWPHERPEVGMSVAAVGQSDDSYEHWITQTANTIEIVLEKLHLLNLKGIENGSFIRNAP